MRPSRITASISVLNGQQKVSAAVHAPQSARTRGSIVHPGCRAPGDDFANVAELSVGTTPFEWGASTIHMVMKPASRRRMDRDSSARGVEATRSGVITGQQMRRIGGS